MFITVTRVGAETALRVAAAAVAHITTMADGSVLHLTSGEQLRVNEPAEDVEGLVCQVLSPQVDVGEVLACSPAATRADLDELLAQRFAELATALGLRTQTSARITSEVADLPPVMQEQPVDRAPRRGRGPRA